MNQKELREKIVKLLMYPSPVYKGFKRHLADSVTDCILSLFEKKEADCKTLSSVEVFDKILKENQSLWEKMGKPINPPEEQPKESEKIEELNNLLDVVKDLGLVITEFGVRVEEITQRAVNKIQGGER